MDVFLPGNTNAIAATATSQSRTLPTGTASRPRAGAVFYNDGPNIAFVFTASTAPTVTLPALSAAAGAAGNGTPVPVGTSVNFGIDSADQYWGAICQSGGTANVFCTIGRGW